MKRTNLRRMLLAGFVAVAGAGQAGVPPKVVGEMDAKPNSFVVPSGPSSL